jgi:hypothetical protein
MAIPLNEVFALVRHAVLHRNAAAQRGNGIPAIATLTTSANPRLTRG